MLLSRELSQRRNVTCGKENRMDFSIKYIDAILRFIVKRVSRRIMLREMRFLRARFSYPFFLYSARNTEDQKSGMREKERERERERIRAKGRSERYPWSVAFNFPEITFLHYFPWLPLPRRCWQLAPAWSYILYVLYGVCPCTYATRKVGRVFIWRSCITQSHVQCDTRKTRLHAGK